MKPSSTWTVIDDGSTPAARIAARTIRKRLQAVWMILPRACRHAGASEEVHQLRVATRRALAALAAFEKLLPEKRRAWFEKQLRRLRRAAGEARDLDVLTDRLQGDASGRTARGRLVAMLSRQRIVSRQPIRDRYERLLEADWPARVERLLESLASEDRHGRFGDYARRRVRRLVGRFFETADRPMRSADELHAFRIEGKKLRYSLEIFATVFPAEVRGRCYKALERLQKTLGDFTDHAAAADRFRRWSHEEAAAAHRDVIERLRRDEERLADHARRNFSAWWNDERRSDLRRAFDSTLRRRTA